MINIMEVNGSHAEQEIKLEAQSSKEKDHYCWIQYNYVCNDVVTYLGYIIYTYQVKQHLYALM